MRAYAVAILTVLLMSMGCKSSPQTQESPSASEDGRTQQAMEDDEDDPQVDESETETTDGERGEPHSEGLTVELIGEPTVSGPGSLSSTAIARVAEERQQRTVSCFETFEGDIAEPSRQVMLTLRLSRDGAVLEVQSSQQNQFGECVAAEVKRWDFPKPEGGEVESTIEFRYDRDADGEADEADGSDETGSE